MDKKTVVNKLKNGFGEVFFTKKDGTDREMYCTLNLKTIEEYDKEHTDNLGEKYYTNDDNTTDMIRVFDLEKKEWRSFLLSKVYELYIDGELLIREPANKGK